MTERTKRVRPGTSPSVRVTRHPVHWEASTELDEITRLGIQALGQRIETGCWYVNPRFTVFSPSSTKEFFRKVIDLRSAWLLTCRQSLGSYGQRQEGRKIQQFGRRECYVDLDSIQSLGAHLYPPPQVLPLSSLSQADREEVLNFGRLAEQAAFGGFLFIDGQFIPSSVWQAMAERLFHPCDEPPFTTTPRHVDLATLKATGNPDHLKHVSLVEIESHLTANPGAALYVCPGISVVAPTSSRAFLAEARKRSKEWNGKLQHFLGEDKRTLSRAADLPTRLLVFHGTLVVEGRIYILGLWPGDKISENMLIGTPFNSPHVPPEYLGLGNLP